MVDRIGLIRADVETVQKKHAAKTKGETANDEPEEESAEEAEPTLAQQAKELLEELEALENALWTPPSTKGIVARDRVLNQVGNVLRSIESSWERPNATQETYLRQVVELVDEKLAALNELVAGPVAELRESVREAEIELLPEMEPLSIN